LKIIWHLGFHKTGTTTIQALLAENIDIITKRTALVIPVRKVDHVGVRISKPLADTMRAYVYEPSASNYDTLLRAVLETVSWARDLGYQQLVYSDEMALGLNVFDKHGDVFGHAQTLLSALDTIDAEIKQIALIYERECTSWLQSAYAQSLKYGRNCLSFVDWRALFPQMTDMPDMLLNVRSSAAFEVRLISMEGEISSNGYLGLGLLQEMGLDPKRIVAASAKNKRMPAAALRFLLRLNRSDVVGARYFKTRSVVLRNPELFED
jgi:hypothetical protein